MTIQSWWLLKQLKKAQKYKDACFGIDQEHRTIKTLCVDAENVRSVTLRLYKNSLESTLEHLAVNDYINYDGNGCGQVLHDGWHWGQITMGKIASFLLRSIAVPVVVAFLTAIITMWLSGTLQFP